MSSNDIYTPSGDTFQPTYLYIKQHSVTGKLYFGKTVNNPEKYFGSGIRWLRHIKKHGRHHVVTLWYCLFTDAKSINEFALLFSNLHNIAKSESWLNLVLENGLQGGDMCSGIKRSDEIKAKLKKPKSAEHKAKIRDAGLGEKNHNYGKHNITAYDLETKKYVFINSSEYHKHRGIKYLNARSKLIPK